MSDLRENLKSEFEDEDYRYSYAESFLNSKIAAQIKTLREQRVKTQAELAELIGTKQSGFSRFEDVNHSVWKTATLWKIARGLGVRLDVSFKTFGSLIHDKENFNKQALECPTFKNDPVFCEETPHLGALVATPGIAAAKQDGNANDYPIRAELGNGLAFWDLQQSLTAASDALMQPDVSGKQGEIPQLVVTGGVQRQGSLSGEKIESIDSPRATAIRARAKRNPYRRSDSTGDSRRRRHG